MKIRIVAVAGLVALAALPAAAQSTGNLLYNPDMELDANGGHTTRHGPVFGSFDAGAVAAEGWYSVTVPSGAFTVDTELVPSDFMPDGNMLHIRAHGLIFLQLRPSLAVYYPTIGHPGSFCAWVKVVQGGGVGVQAADVSNGVTPTGAWQQLIDTTGSTTPNGPAISVVATSTVGPDGSRTFDDMDFYVATADYTLRTLTNCPRATLDDVSVHRQPLDLPPRRPVVEHPNWSDPLRDTRGKPDRRQQQNAPPPQGK